jgi:hypothetical protein
MPPQIQILFFTFILIVNLLTPFQIGRTASTVTVVYTLYNCALAKQLTKHAHSGERPAPHSVGIAPTTRKARRLLRVAPGRLFEGKSFILLGSLNLLF